MLVVMGFIVKQKQANCSSSGNSQKKNNNYRRHDTFKHKWTSNAKGTQAFTFSVQAAAPAGRTMVQKRFRA